MARYLVTTKDDTIEWEGAREGLNRVLQNAKNLLLCRMGEIPFDRFRGLDVAISELPLADLEKALMIEVDRALSYEDECEAVEARAVPQTDGTVYFEVVIETDAEAM